MFTVGLPTGCQTTPAPLVFQPATLPDAQQGVAYEARIDIDANVTDVNQFVIRGGALPPGLMAEKISSESSAGKISGIPEAAGSFTFTLYVDCFGTQVSGQTGSKEYTIVVR